MMDIKFRKPTLADKDEIDYFFHKYPSRSCERTFANIYLWSRKDPVTYGIVDKTLVFKREHKDSLAFTFPAGEPEDVKEAMKSLKKYANERNFPFVLYFVTPPQFAEIEELYPGRFNIEYKRDVADYVYEYETLEKLSGKKLHGKRNHINKFLINYEGRWSYERITEDNIEECFQMALRWGRANGAYDDPEKNAELAVSLNSLRLFEELGFVGGLLRIEGQVIAFTSGEAVTDDTFVVHIEKAMAFVEGAYPMINQQFVINECKDYKYINREDDAGVEGLRIAKLSYKPAFLVEKGEVRENEDKE
ncbi:MAG TPA: DUF2156 domain-containing protein [Candidatus Dorea intestinavium]|nr:DUF2156 domain-containing protein [Candidatus Dorea intestinavium]